MKRILVTILTWNRVKLLKNTINTFFRKNKKRYFDVLVYDNGSTDKTKRYLKSIKVPYIGGKKNIGIFGGTSELWMHAHNKGYDFVINIQNDFPCIRPIPFMDMMSYMDRNSDVGFVLLNNKGRVIKVSSSGKRKVVNSIKNKNKYTLKKLKYKKWQLEGKTYFVKFNHHFTFNPTFVRTSILPDIVTDNSKRREWGIMKRYNESGLLSAKIRKPYFDTIIRHRNVGWKH